jgi:hypothetical protein
MDYEYQGKKDKIYNMKFVVFEIYILPIRSHKTFVVCEYQLWRQCFIIIQQELVFTELIL